MTRNCAISGSVGLEHWRGRVRVRESALSHVVQTSPPANLHMSCWWRRLYCYHHRHMYANCANDSWMVAVLGSSAVDMMGPVQCLSQETVSSNVERARKVQGCISWVRMVLTACGYKNARVKYGVVVVLLPFTLTRRRWLQKMYTLTPFIAVATPRAREEGSIC